MLTELWLASFPCLPKDGKIEGKKKKTIVGSDHHTFYQLLTFCAKYEYSFMESINKTFSDLTTYFFS